MIIRRSSYPSPPHWEALSYYLFSDASSDVSEEGSIGRRCRRWPSNGEALLQAVVITLLALVEAQGQARVDREVEVVAQDRGHISMAATAGRSCRKFIQVHPGRASQASTSRIGTSTTNSLDNRHHQRSQPEAFGMRKVDGGVGEFCFIFASFDFEMMANADGPV